MHRDGEKSVLIIVIIYTIYAVLCVGRKGASFTYFRGL